MRLVSGERMALGGKGGDEDGILFSYVHKAD